MTEVCIWGGYSRLSGCYATAVFRHACARCIVGVSERCWISAGAEEQRRLEMVQHQQGEKAQRSRQRNYAALLKLSLWDFTPSTEEQVSKLFFVRLVIFLNKTPPYQSACPVYVGTLSIVMLRWREPQASIEDARARENKIRHGLDKLLRHLGLSQ